NFANVAFDSQRNRRFSIVVRRSTVDYDVRHSALRGHERKRSRWINRQGRTERYHQIGLRRCLPGAIERLWFQALAKTDRRRLQKTATLAKWRPAMAPKEFEVPLRVAARFTTDTLDEKVRA